MFAGINPALLAVAASLIWGVRTLLLQPFVDAEGHFPASAAEADLPLSTEVFFSLLMLALVVATLIACWFIFRTQSPAGYAKQGLTAGLWLVGICTLYDLLFQTVFGAHSFMQYVVRVWIDYAPVLIIPIGLGLILERFAPPAPAKQEEQEI